MAWVDGAAVLAHVAGAGTPSTAPADVDWADKCAAAIDAEVAHALGDDSTIADDDTSGMALAIIPAALTDAAALYMTRKAPHGVLQDADGEAIRLGANDLRALLPILARVSPGIG